MIKVGIIEDNEYMREGWETFIDFEDDLTVIGSFGSCEEAFESEVINKINVAIMDIGLPGMSGIEGVNYMREHHPDVNIIMATVHDDDDHIFDALKAGAVGYLMKKVTPDEMVSAIRDAHNGGSPITPNIARKVIATFQKAADLEEELSEREIQILKELATGRSYAAIGKKIFLSVDGVRHHIRNIYQKLEVHSRSEAIAKGISKRIINPDRD
ncbi:response regulator transcription factor [Gracilimonas tropica]|uniref:response regulator transcription factor n=1 Tax=Gracilimonas tropica TaxID=454600 RepID=UPI0004768687|nr:response regulator transcription factor [Gracilimonas tropica]